MKKLLAIIAAVSCLTSSLLASDWFIGIGTKTGSIERNYEDSKRKVDGDYVENGITIGVIRKNFDRSFIEISKTEIENKKDKRDNTETINIRFNN